LILSQCDLVKTIDGETTIGADFLLGPICCPDLSLLADINSGELEAQPFGGNHFSSHDAAPVAAAPIPTMLFLSVAACVAQ
jgi:hypothetical protein